MGYILILFIYSLIWGVVCNKVIENKGYNDNWFWWGFLFGIFAFLVAVTKPQNTHTYIDRYGNVDRSSESVLSQMANERSNREIIQSGGWKCNHCRRMNPAYVGTCSCGWTRSQSEKYIEPPKQEQDKMPIQNEASVTGNLDILKKYKELLDMGAISEDEFNKKKEELLANDPHDKKADSQNANTETASDIWQCSNCGTENTLDRKSCRYCGAIKTDKPYTPKKILALENWTCPNCFTVNKCYIGRCQCGTSKPAIE